MTPPPQVVMPPRGVEVPLVRVHHVATGFAILLLGRAVQKLHPTSLHQRSGQALPHSLRDLVLIPLPQVHGQRCPAPFDGKPSLHR